MKQIKNIPKDKWLHFGVCAIAAILEPWLGVGLAIGKEYGDYKAIGRWEWDDSIADAIGVIVGGVIHYIIFTIP
jgi:hypothetical protein